MGAGKTVIMQVQVKSYLKINEKAKIMLTGNEYIFPNIDKALGYVLATEHQKRP